MVDCLVGKALAALRQTGLRVRSAWAAAWRPTPGCASGWPKRPGGRASGCTSRRLRLCTDNAVMGAIAVERLQAGLFEDLDLDVYPGVVRKPSA